MNRKGLNLSSPVETGTLIGGRWIGGEQRFRVTDKFTGELLAEMSQASAADVEAAVKATANAFEKGAPEPIVRARILRCTAEIIAARRADFAEAITAEAGFTTTDANVEIDRSLVTLNLCAEEATRLVGETVPFAATAGQHERIGFTIRVPIGIVCAITPFNSPLNTVIHKIGPAIAAGNAVILKPSSLTPLTATLLCAALLDAELPPDLLALVHGNIGELLLDRQEIAFYSFTGSTRVGRIIQQKAGLRRTQLELGSIASTIVCADADLDRALPRIANAAFRKAGQVCTSIQRLYVENGVKDKVADGLVDLARKMPAGNPRDPTTRVGPMISEEAAARAQSWVREAELGQARVLTGGDRSGPVLSPTVLANVGPGLKVLEQEIFAPVVSVLPFATLGEAVNHANNTPYGLAAGSFTRDINRAIGAARGLRFGSVHINETSSSRGDAMPFGGVKDSGYGHEGPKYAIREVTEERLITLNF